MVDMVCCHFLLSHSMAGTVVVCLLEVSCLHRGSIGTSFMSDFDVITC